MDILMCRQLLRGKILGSINLFLGHNSEVIGATIFDIGYLNEDSIAAAAQANINGKALDVLVNCGGIDMYPERWIDTAAESLVYRYRIMIMVRIIVTSHFEVMRIRSGSHHVK